jgi:UDP-N-acetylmuramate: L-alanyl-gamma-D-glutamyl-meso-diaminopimelate ligase
MGSLAGLLKSAGHEVRGSDTGAFPPMSIQLNMFEIPVVTEHKPENLDWGPDRVVVGNVCRKDHVEVTAARKRGLPMISMAQVLEEEFLQDRVSVMVTGTHGKTTSASMLAYMLETAGRDPSFFIGGVPQNFGWSCKLGQGKDFVVEGDEYDTAFFDKKSKFFHYCPKNVLLTGVEFDHADIFSSLDDIKSAFREMVAMIPAQGVLVAHQQTPPDILAAARCPVYCYRLSTQDANTTAANAELATETWTGKVLPERDGRFLVFQLFAPNEKHVGTFRHELWGEHNTLNAIGCALLLHKMGLDWPVIGDGVAGFRGVQRRQEVRGVATGVTVIDDFAHHPTAVRETLRGLQHRYEDRRIFAVFEPRSATSRRAFFQERFAEALSYGDNVVIAPVHHQDELSDAERLDPEQLAHDIRLNGTPARHLPSIEKIVDDLAQRTRPGDLVVFMSSGSFSNIHHKLLVAIGDAITAARLSHASELETFLEEFDLVPVNLRKHIDEFYILRGKEEMIGCVGLETRGRAGLIKSLAVVSDRQGEGLGFMLAQSAVDRARDRGLKHLYMFGTETTSKIGRLLGFSPFPREEVEKEMAASPEFTRPLHVRSELMRLNLEPTRFDSE